MVFLLNVLFDLGKKNFVDAIIYTCSINISIWVEESKWKSGNLQRKSSTDGSNTSEKFRSN